MSVDEIYERPISSRRCNVPTCPCQDGDACNFITASGTVAHPLPAGYVRLSNSQREALGWIETIGRASSKLVLVEGYSVGPLNRLVELGLVLKADGTYYSRNVPR